MIRRTNYNFERIHNDNLVVGRYKNLAIVKNEMGALYYIECDENEAPIGTIVDDDMLNPINNLMSHERQYIYRIFGDKMYDLLRDEDEEDPDEDEIY